MILPLLDELELPEEERLLALPDFLGDLPRLEERYVRDDFLLDLVLPE